MIKHLIQKLRTILVWSQKYTKTDMVYLARGGFWLSVGQAAGSVSALIVSILFANLISRETYGIYKYVLSVVSILSIFTLPQMATAVTQSVARGFEGSMFQVLKTELGWGSIGSLVSGAMAAYYYVNGNHLLAGSFLVVTLFLPVFGSIGIYDAFLCGRKRFDVSTRYNIISQAFSVAAIVAAIVFSKNLIVILIAYFGSRTLIGVMLFARTLKVFKPNAQQDPHAATYGTQLSFIGALNTVAGYLDRIIVYHYLGAVPLAVYSIAIAPPEQIKGFVGLIDIMGLPNFSKRSEKEIRASMRQKFFRLFLVGSAITVVYFIAAPIFFRVVFPKYIDALQYSQIYAFSFLNLTVWPAGLFLRAKKKIKEMQRSSVYGSILKIAVMLLFVKFWGLLGLVIAKVLGRWIGELINLVYYRLTPLDSAEASLPGTVQG